MNAMTERDLTDYILGTAPPERSREIKEIARHDEELTAKIGVMRMLFGVAAQPHRRRSVALLRRHKVLTAALFLVAFLGMSAMAAWAIIYEPPLLQDNFNTRAFDAELWLHQPEVVRKFNEPMGISVKERKLRLVNRAFLITRKEFPEPISLTFDWSWVELGPYDPRYSEHLIVALRTTGKVSREHPYEIKDGVRIMFNVWDQYIQIAQHVNGEGKALAYTQDAGVKVPIPSDEVHQIKVTDDGESVSVYFKGPEIDPKYERTPILRARCTHKFQERHIAIYNRELVGMPHESLIDNVVVRKLLTRE